MVASRVSPAGGIALKKAGVTGLQGALVASLFMSGCESGAPTSQDRDIAVSSPVLMPLDTFFLHDGASTGLSRPGNMSIDDATGDFFVSDLFGYSVLQYSRSGEFIKEFLFYTDPSVGAGGFGGIVGVSDSALFVYDYVEKIIKRTTLSAGHTRPWRPYRGRLTSGIFAGDTIWLGMFDLETDVAVGVVPLEVLDDTIRAELIPLPTSYREYSSLSSIFDLTFVSKWTDSLAVAFSGTSELLIFRLSDGASRIWPVPVRDRHGTPEDRLGEFAGGGLTFDQFFESWSAVFGVHRLPSGEIAVIHFDQEITGRHISSTVYLSVMNPRDGRACVDALVPTTQQSQPAVAFHHDTLVVVENVALGETGGGSLVRRFGIDMRPCFRSP